MPLSTVAPSALGHDHKTDDPLFLALSLEDGGSSGLVTGFWKHSDTITPPGELN